MKQKLLTYAGALGVMGLIVGVLLLIFGSMGKEAPAVGTVTVITEQGQVEPISHEFYTTKEKVRKDGKRLVPEEIGATAPVLPFDGQLNVSYENGSDNGGFYFTVYNEAYEVYSDKKAFFDAPKDSGKYLVCQELYWGREEENIGVEYYYWLEVS